MNSIRNFILELFPLFVARKIQPGYHRPDKENAIASLIRSIVFIIIFGYFCVRAYMVPTGSMKYTINEKDFLLVNRFIYGVKTPDQIGIPMSNIYFKRELASFRITPQLRDIAVNDVIVFRADHEEPPLEYVKRLVATSGDSLKMNEGIIYNNGNVQPHVSIAKVPEGYSKLNHKNDSTMVFTQRANLLNHIAKSVFDSYDFPHERSVKELFNDVVDKSLEFTLTLKKDLIDYPELSKMLYNGLREAKLQRQRYGSKMQFSEESYDQAMFRSTKVYISNRYYANIQNIDNFETFYIPKEGDVIDFRNTHSDIISNVVFYDGHFLDYKDGTYFIDGNEATSYTVEQDYYFFIGDNRHGSLDSRYWGMIPHKYVIGTPILKYFSINDEFWNHPSRANNSFLSKFADLLMNPTEAINWDQIGQLIL